MRSLSVLLALLAVGGCADSRSSCPEGSTEISKAHARSVTRSCVVEGGGIGVPHGPTIEKHEGGAVLFEGSYEHGRPVGVHIHRNVDRSLLMVEEHKGPRVTTVLFESDWPVAFAFYELAPEPDEPRIVGESPSSQRATFLLHQALTLHDALAPTEEGIFLWDGARSAAVQVRY